MTLSGQMRIMAVCNKCLHIDAVYMNNRYCYGSPLIKCSHCGNEYIENRLHEPAIEGINQASMNDGNHKKAVIVLLILTVVFVLLCILVGDEPIELFSVILGLAIVSALGAIFNARAIIRIRSGAMEQDNKRWLAESEYRLSNREYAEKLKNFGYNVPEKYLK